MIFRAKFQKGGIVGAMAALAFPLFRTYGAYQKLPKQEILVGFSFPYVHLNSEPITGINSAAAETFATASPTAQQ